MLFIVVGMMLDCYRNPGMNKLCVPMYVLVQRHVCICVAVVKLSVYFHNTSFSFNMVYTIHVRMYVCMYVASYIV